MGQRQLVAMLKFHLSEGNGGHPALLSHQGLPLVLHCAVEIILIEAGDQQIFETILPLQPQSNEIQRGLQRKAPVKNIQCKRRQPVPYTVALGNNFSERLSLHLRMLHILPFETAGGLLFGLGKRHIGTPNQLLCRNSRNVCRHTAVEAEFQRTVPHKTGIAVLQLRQSPAALCRRYPRQPYQKFVRTGPHQNRLTARLLFRHFPQQPGKFLQQDIAEGESAVFHDIRKTIQIQQKQHTRGLLPPPPFDLPLPRCHADEAGHRILHFSRFPRQCQHFTCMNIPKISHDLPLLILGICHHSSLVGIPVPRRVILHPHTDFSGQVLLLAVKKQGTLFLILLRQLSGDHLVPEDMQGPDAVIVAAVDQFQCACSLPIGEEHVIGALHGDPIAFLFLLQLLLNPQLAVCQLLRHIMQLIHLQDTGGTKGLQPLTAAPHTVHQTVDRPHDPIHHQKHQYHAGRRTNQNDGQYHTIQAIAQSENRVLRHKAQKHPVGIFVGHLILIEPQRRLYRIYLLAAHLHALHLIEIPMLRFRQSKAVCILSQDLIENTLAGNPLITAVRLLRSQHIARPLVHIQILHRQIGLHQIADRGLCPQYTVNPAVAEQGHGIGDHSMVVHPAVLQHEGHGPVGQIRHVHILVFQCQKIRFIEKIIRLPFSRI